MGINVEQNMKNWREFFFYQECLYCRKQRSDIFMAGLRTALRDRALTR